MAHSKTAALSGLLVSKKRDAPAPVQPPLEAAQPPFSSVRAAEATPPLAQGSEPALYYKALTLKVDRERFTKLKNLGVQKDQRSQALMTEALDLLFSRHGM